MKKKNYIKRLLFTITLVASGTMITLSNVTASDIISSNSLSTDENLSIQEQIDKNTTLKDLTIEEIYSRVAEGSNISYEEAKKELLDEARVRYYQENAKARSFVAVSESTLENYVVGSHKQLESFYYLVNADGAKCFLRFGALVEIRGSGSFTYISAIKKGTEFILAHGTGNHTYTGGYITSSLVDGNRIRIFATGNVESIVSQTHGPAYSKKGFSFGGTVGNDIIYRKSVTLDKVLKLHTK